MPHRFSFAAILFLCFVTSAATARSDTLRLIDTPADAMATAIELIDSAQNEIVISTYIIDTGDSAATMLRHVADASKRGVSVRLIHDDFETPLPKTWVRYLCQVGVKVRVYNSPCLLTPVELNWRLHAKIFIVDRCTGIIGSRNWQDSHYLVDAQESFIDQDLQISGSLAVDAAEYFDKIWQCERSKPVSLNDSFRFDLWNLGERGRHQSLAR